MDRTYRTAELFGWNECTVPVEHNGFMPTDRANTRNPKTSDPVGFSVAALPRAQPTATERNSGKEEDKKKAMMEIGARIHSG